MLCKFIITEFLFLFHNHERSPAPSRYPMQRQTSIQQLLQRANTKSGGQLRALCTMPEIIRKHFDEIKVIKVVYKSAWRECHSRIGFEMAPWRDLHQYRSGLWWHTMRALSTQNTRKNVWCSSCSCRSSENIL